ncbi:hypothetical protein R3P38DRAFT_2765321 [Favolaschia claudopus]|uniref:Uncharacterized protein n=1 Tax=Favolaschia claudopus TaxID=2862362 RepID=A0AAW0D5Y7_9AGAR
MPLLTFKFNFNDTGRNLRSKSCPFQFKLQLKFIVVIERRDYASLPSGMFSECRDIRARASFNYQVQFKFDSTELNPASYPYPPSVDFDADFQRTKTSIQFSILQFQRRLESILKIELEFRVGTLTADLSRFAASTSNRRAATPFKSRGKTMYFATYEQMRMQLVPSAPRRARTQSIPSRHPAPPPTSNAPPAFSRCSLEAAARGQSISTIKNKAKTGPAASDIEGTRRGAFAPCGSSGRRRVEAGVLIQGGRTIGGDGAGRVRSGAGRRNGGCGGGAGLSATGRKTKTVRMSEREQSVPRTLRSRVSDACTSHPNPRSASAPDSSSRSVGAPGLCCGRRERASRRWDAKDKVSNDASGTGIDGASCGSAAWVDFRQGERETAGLMAHGVGGKRRIWVAFGGVVGGTEHGAMCIGLLAGMRGAHTTTRRESDAEKGGIEASVRAAQRLPVRQRGREEKGGVALGKEKGKTSQNESEEKARVTHLSSVVVKAGWMGNASAFEGENTPRAIEKGARVPRRALVKREGGGANIGAGITGEAASVDERAGGKVARRQAIASACFQARRKKGKGVWREPKWGGGSNRVQ